MINIHKASAALSRQIRESTKFIKSKTRLRPTLAVVLGSGLGEFVESLSTQCVIDASLIPHYPRSTVAGHHGKLVFAKLGKTPILAFQGRVHYYETGNLETILYPIRIAHELGITKVLFTNAAGGVNPDFCAGDLMVIEDHLNLTFQNPLVGVTGTRTSHHVYDRTLLRQILTGASREGVPSRKGVYCGLKGPSYETAAEVRLVRKLGADAVGMSTVNEASFAAAVGMRVAGISCITNLCTGLSGEKLSHDEVTLVANRVRQSFSTLLVRSIQEISASG